MKRRGTLTIVLLAGVAALVAVFASTGSAQQPVSQTLTFVERDNQGTFHFVDVRPKSTRRGEPSVSPGDSFYGTSPLYDAANKRRQGKLFFKCTAVTRSKRFGGSTFLCDGTFRLSNGTLVVSATFKGNKAPAGPVIGGTGAYEGASGGFSSVDRRRTTVDTLHFDTD
jgi:hypothetical protein